MSVCFLNLMVAGALIGLSLAAIRQTLSWHNSTSEATSERNPTQPLRLLGLWSSYVWLTVGNITRRYYDYNLQYLAIYIRRGYTVEEENWIQNASKGRRLGDMKHWLINIEQTCKVVYNFNCIILLLFRYFLSYNILVYMYVFHGEANL